MKASNISFGSAGVLLCLAMLTGCGSMGMRADRAKVDAIQTVAVVGFAVPHKVESNEKSSVGSKIGFIKNMVKNDGNILKAAQESNGAQVATAAFAGFSEEMARDSRMKLMPAEEVVANEKFAALLANYDESEKFKATKNGVPGLAVIQLEMGTEKLEFAQKAAEALGVDGVIVIDFYSMAYDRISGGGATGIYTAGQAKVKEYALYNLFDRNGQSVWASPSYALSNVTAGIAGDAIEGDPTELHKDAGAQMAAVVKKDYQEWAKKAK